MAIDLKILPDLNLIVMTWSGRIDAGQSDAALQEYATHPQARSGQNILSDMRAVTHSRFDLPKRLAIQAKLERILKIGDTPRHIVYYAPTEVSQLMATQYAALWAVTPSVTAEVLSDESQALRALDLSVGSIADLLAGTRR